jgi:hypothetical protein
MWFREQVGLQISHSDRVHVIEKGLSRAIEVCGRNPKSNRKYERQ